MSGFRLAGVSLVYGGLRFLRLSGSRLAVVSLVDGREFPVIQDPEFRLAAVSLVDGGFRYCPHSD